MILPRNTASVCVLSIFVTALPASSSVEASDGLDAGVVQQVASRCSDFGDDFVDLGNGVCGRIGNRIRVQMGTHNASSNTWSSGGTANAALRSDGAGMLPGAGESHHLRVRSGLDSYSPFR